MVFSSVTFLVWFLPVLTVGYHLLHPSYRNLFLLGGSLIFYAWGAPKFIFLILLTTFLDFHLVRRMGKSVEMGDTVGKRRWLWLSLGLNIGLLGIFKYANFFVENAYSTLRLVGWEPGPWVRIALPLGLSFFVFESLTYVWDVYRGKEKPLPGFQDYLLYILFFPKLIAGPILRYHEMAPQIRNRSAQETADNFLLGFFRFCLGLGKKLWIANPIGFVVLPLLAKDPSSVSSVEAWLAISGFALELYFDFSGYSDMAIGLARMFGFILPENFNNPFLSKSLTEFWKRWNISLGKWMHAYLYLPLGGNQGGVWRTYRNLWIVFLVSGLWHGAEWTFVVWGVWHGIFLTLDKLGMKGQLERWGWGIGPLFTFWVVAMGCVFFQIPELPRALAYFTRLFSFSGGGFPQWISPDKWLSFGMALAFTLLPALSVGKKIQDWTFSSQTDPLSFVAKWGLSLLIFWLCLSMASWVSFNPFLYFRF